MECPKCLQPLDSRRQSGTLINCRNRFGHNSAGMARHKSIEFHEALSHIYLACSYIGDQMASMRNNDAISALLGVVIRIQTE